MPSPNDVVVTNLTAVMPSETNDRPQFLWEQFANKPEETRFTSYRTKDWKQNYRVFATTLIQKAKEKEMDAASLQKVLEQILSSAGKLAYLPVGAYQANLNNAPTWIVVVKWEVAGNNYRLGHVCIFAYDQKTLKQVAFKTCT